MIKKTLFISFVLVSVLWATNVTAQRNNGNMQRHKSQKSMCVIPGLTDQQIEEINALKLPHQKVILDLQNQIAEKEARLITLTTGDNIDVAAAKEVMKEISALKLKMAEAHLDHRMAVRKLLNDEQKLWFDLHQTKGKNHNGHGSNGPEMKNGMHSGQGHGDCQEHGNGSGMHDGNGPHGTGH